jgi:outer membrane protein assembly factor BamB
MSNGSTLWTRDLSSSRGLDLDDRHVFVTDEKGAVHALDIANGASAWKQDQLAGRGTGRPRCRRYVVVGDVEGYVHLLRKDDGSLVGRQRAIPVRFLPTRSVRRRHRRPDARKPSPSAFNNGVADA